MGCPWNYQNISLLLKELKPNENPRQVELTKLLFWVQIHNIPRGFWSECTAKDIGNHLGDFVAADPTNFLSIWQEYMRVRVEVDVRVPIKRKLLIRCPKENAWVDFVYEKLIPFAIFVG